MPQQGSLFEAEFVSQNPARNEQTRSAIVEVQNYIVEKVAERHGGYAPVPNDPVFTAVECLTHLVGGLIAENRSLHEKIANMDLRLRGLDNKRPATS